MTSATEIVLQAEMPVRVTHPDKQLFAQPPTDKLAYLNYLVQMAPALLQHLHGRRITLVRCPDGVTGGRFYQRHVQKGAPDWLPSVPGEEGKPEIVIPDVATLLYYGNLGALEFHATLALIGSTAPTSLSFDLDPSTDDFEPVCTVALHLRDVLDSLALDSVVKTSGKSGLQVFVPLAKPVPDTQTKAIVAFVAKYMEERWPKLVTTARLIRERGQRVYIDVPQHGHTKTLIASYSTRATTRATVSTPLAWNELEAGCLPEQFTIHNVPNRFTKYGDIFAQAKPSSIQHIMELLKQKR